MTDGPYAPPPASTPGRARADLPDAAAVVLLAVAVAALLAGLVLGVRGFLQITDTDPTTQLCTTPDVSMGECRLAVDLRRTTGNALLTQGGAAAVAGAVLLVAGTRRGNAVARRRTAAV